MFRTFYSRDGYEVRVICDSGTLCVLIEEGLTEWYSWNKLGLKDARDSLEYYTTFNNWIELA